MRPKTSEQPMKTYAYLLPIFLIVATGCEKAAPVTMFEKAPDRDYAKIETRQPMSSIAFVLPDSQIAPFMHRMKKTLPTPIPWSTIQQVSRNVDEMSPGDSRSFRLVGSWQGENVMMDMTVVSEPQATILYFFAPRTMLAEVAEPLKLQYLEQMAFSLSHM